MSESIEAETNEHDVSIAEAEAAAAVSIAEAQAEAQADTAEALIAAADEAEDEWRNQIQEGLNHATRSLTSLSSETQELRTALQTLDARLSLLIQQQPEPNPEPNPTNPAPEPDAPEVVETETEAEPPEEPARPERKRAHRWI